MTLTRPQFELACKAYLAKYPSVSSLSYDGHANGLLKRYPSGWTWNEHPLVQGLGYLSRLVSLQYGTAQDSLGSDVDAAHEDDDSATASPSSDMVTCRQYIVFSPTFQVPAFYFSMHHSSGVPLSLEEITASRLFLRSALPDTAQTTFALSVPESSFAMLSQGDHPTLNTPCWYLHPCHTAEVVDEIMREVGSEEKDRPLRWLEAWIMMLGNVVDFRVE